MSIYALKPRFQALLRPMVRALYGAGITANQVTLLACGISVALGVVLYAIGQPHWAFALVPLWMLLRMALNAIDGMLAREFGQKSLLGGYLNELTDVVSDAALYLPFVWVMPFTGLQIGMLIWMAALSELAGVLGVVAGASRRYDGPFGKSDRAFVFGALGLWVASSTLWGYSLPTVAYGFMWALIAVTAWTCIRRVRAGLQEAVSASGQNDIR